MANPEDEQLKLEALLKTVAETKQLAPKLMEAGRAYTEAGRTALDWANHMESMAKQAPDGFFSDPGFDLVHGTYVDFNSNAQKALSQSNAIHLRTLARLTSTSTAVVSGSAAYGMQTYGSGPWGGKQPATVSTPPSITWPVRSAYFQNLPLKLNPNIEEIKESLRSFGLDAAKGTSASAVQNLEVAAQALRAPFADAGYAASVLLPAREAIYVTLDELLKQRPDQEKARGLTKKVLSLAEHLGMDGVSAAHVTAIAATGERLIDALSESKASPLMPHERIRDLFDQTASWLRDVLSILDRNKLRLPPAG